MEKKRVYIISSSIFFIVCVLIVVLLSDNHLIRGFLGDVLVIAFIYSFIKIFIDLKPIKLCISILLFAYIVEFIQYLKFVELVGLGENRIARIIIGTTFDVRDLLAYTLGAIFTYILEIKLFKRFL